MKKLGQAPRNQLTTLGDMCHGSEPVPFFHILGARTLPNGVIVLTSSCSLTILASARKMKRGAVGAAYLNLALRFGEQSYLDGPADLRHRASRMAMIGHAIIAVGIPNAPRPQRIPAPLRSA